MAKPQRNLLLIIVPCALLAGWFAFGDSVFSQKAQSEQTTSSKDKAKDNLQQAADSIVAVAKERVAAAKTDDEAIQRARLSDQALSLVGKLGEFDTTPQSDELLNSFRTGGRPVIVDAVIQLRLANDLRTWEEMSDTQHAAAFNRFVADVKKTGVTRGQAEMLVRVANMLGDGDDSKLISKAVDEVLPLVRESDDAELKRIAPIYEGIQRRLTLLGKPLEMEGTLLNGSKLNWNSYRGKVVLVDFFASFCDPCRVEVPNVLENYRAYHEKGFDVVGVNLDTQRKMCQLYMEQTGFNFPTIFGDALNAAGWDLPLARKYGVTRIPRVILVDQSGNVVSTMARGERLGELLAQLLGPSDHPPVRTTSRSEDPSITTAGGTSLESGGVVPASAQEEINPIEAAPAPPNPPDEPKK
jgi:thiol-disulfide isomerase/thioredoxin